MVAEAVDVFLASVEDERRRDDSRALLEIMRDATKSSPMMWGSIVGFGRHHYRYDSGREGDTVAVGFSPRKSAFVLYGLIEGEPDQELTTRLGKVQFGKGCVYIKRLSDVDTGVLAQMIETAYTARHNG